MAKPENEPVEPESQAYRLFVNPERTVLVRFWSLGTVEFAMRDTPSHTWGPPAILTEETVP